MLCRDGGFVTHGGGVLIMQCWSLFAAGAREIQMSRESCASINLFCAT